MTTPEGQLRSLRSSTVLGITLPPPPPPGVGVTLLMDTCVFPAGFGRSSRPEFSKDATETEAQYVEVSVDPPKMETSPHSSCITAQKEWIEIDSQECQTRMPAHNMDMLRCSGVSAASWILEKPGTYQRQDWQVVAKSGFNHCFLPVKTGWQKM